MIRYRPTHALRMSRRAMPEPPFHARTYLSPYNASVSFPASVDWRHLTASASHRHDISFCEDVRDSLERERAVDSPVLVEATGRAEAVYARGAALTEALVDSRRGVVHLASLDGGVAGVPDGVVLALGTWPPDAEALAAICRGLRERKGPWGVVIPVVPGATTEIETVNQLCATAADGGAGFIAAVPIDADPAARSRIALDRGIDEEEYASLFDGRDETLLVATERHVAALAVGRGLQIDVPHPGGEPLSNWYAAAFLTTIATRMLRMERDVELAWLLQRSARVVADLGKPLRWIAESANLSIVQELDEVSVEILEAWLEGEQAMLVRDVNEEWPLRRDDYR